MNTLIISIISLVIALVVPIIIIFGRNGYNKRSFIIVGILLLVYCVCFRLIDIFVYKSQSFNIESAAKIYLRHNGYGEHQKIDSEIIDEDDVEAFKKLFCKTESFEDGLLATMFLEDMSLTFIDENNKTIAVLYPDVGFSGVFLVDSVKSYRYLYISNRDIPKFQSIIRKYGVNLD